MVNGAMNYNRGHGSGFGKAKEVCEDCSIFAEIMRIVPNLPWRRLLTPTASMTTSATIQKPSILI